MTARRPTWMWCLFAGVLLTGCPDNSFLELEICLPAKQDDGYTHARVQIRRLTDDVQFDNGFVWAGSDDKNIALRESGTAGELAAKSQLGIGLCRLEQKRWEDAATALLTVYYTYDYPDLSAPALYEAAAAYLQLKKPEEAKGLLTRVVKENPGAPWVEKAQKRLSEIK